MTRSQQKIEQRILEGAARTGISVEEYRRRFNRRGNILVAVVLLTFIATLIWMSQIETPEEKLWRKERNQAIHDARQRADEAAEKQSWIDAGGGDR